MGVSLSATNGMDLDVRTGEHFAVRRLHKSPGSPRFRVAALLRSVRGGRHHILPPPRECLWCESMKSFCLGNKEAIWVRQTHDFSFRVNWIICRASGSWAASPWPSKLCNSMVAIRTVIPFRSCPRTPCVSIMSLDLCAFGDARVIYEDVVVFADRAEATFVSTDSGGRTAQDFSARARYFCDGHNGGFWTVWTPT